MNNTMYDIFERRLREPRIYRYSGGPYSHLLDHDPTGGRIQIIEYIKGHGFDESEEGFDSGYTVVQTVPCMHKAEKGAVIEAEARMNSRLPADMRDFYSRWNGGYMPLLYEYRILTLAEMTAEYERYYDAGERPQIIRFCDVDDGDTFAVRHAAGASSVVYAGAGISEMELFVNDEYVTDKSFAAWLERMVETDGWPITPWSHAECCNVRVH